jgi:hypothetical protein
VVQETNGTTMKELLQWVIVPLTVGAVGSLIASLIWMRLLRTTPPVIGVSSVLAWNGRSLRFKLVNQTKRLAWDVRVEAVVLTPSGESGAHRGRTVIEPIQPPPILLPGLVKSSTTYENAVRIALRAEPSSLSKGQVIRVRVFARDGLSGVGDYFSAEYNAGSIVLGEFEFGDSMEVH